MESIGALSPQRGIRKGGIFFAYGTHRPRRSRVHRAHSHGVIQKSLRSGSQGGGSMRQKRENQGFRTEIRHPEGLFRLPRSSERSGYRSCGHLYPSAASRPHDRGVSDRRQARRLRETLYRVFRTSGRREAYREGEVRMFFGTAMRPSPSSSCTPTDSSHPKISLFSFHCTSIDNYLIYP